MKKYCLVGKKLTYSHSKIIHDYLIEKYNLDASYELIEVTKVTRELLEDYDGLTITIPYKTDVLAFVDENTTSLPANTIVNDNNHLTAYNTDIIGFGALVDQLTFKDINKIVVLGSGSSSKMVQEYFKGKELIVISRNDPQLNYDYLDKLSGDILVNTTPVGMSEYNSPIKEELLINYRGIIDLNYNPVNSKLAMDSYKNNIEFYGGLAMLIKQAVAAFEIWHRITVDNDIIQKIYQKIMLLSQTKIALIGMPLSGKTSIINKYNGCDLDLEIQRKTKRTVYDMLNDNSFRKNEYSTLVELVKREEKLIACGGGVVLKHENMELLKDYLIIYLETPLTELKERLRNSNRPLLNNASDIDATFIKRELIYKKYANLILNRKQTERFIEEHKTTQEE